MTYPRAFRSFEDEVGEPEDSTISALVLVPPLRREAECLTPQGRVGLLRADDV